MQIETMIIRKAKLKDVPDIVKMWKEFMEEHDKIVTSSESKLREQLKRKKEAEKLFKDYIAKNIRSKNSILFIAEVNGEPIGYNMSHIKPDIPIFEIDKLGLVSDMFVKKRHRGSKISSMFKENAFNWFKKKGVKYASIILHAPNSYAHSVYKNWGFIDHKIEMRKKL